MQKEYSSVAYAPARERSNRYHARVPMRFTIDVDRRLVTTVADEGWHRRLRLCAVENSTLLRDFFSDSRIILRAPASAG
jgi:hypothetical protein